MNKILLVDDEINVLNALRRALMQIFRDAPPQIEAFLDPYDALKRICFCDFDVVICDYGMPQMTGSELLQVLKDVAPNTVRIMLSASCDFATVVSAINQAQAFRFLGKPWDAAELEQTVRLALALRAELVAAAPLTAAQHEARRLEIDEPGILYVRRDDDGSVIM